MPVVSPKLLSTRFIGVDIGANGCIAILDKKGVIESLLPFKKFTYADIAEELSEMKGICEFKVCVERVHSGIFGGPAGKKGRMGVVSAFTFGRNYGTINPGLFTGLRIPIHEEVLPAAWQKVMGCRTKGDKNVTKIRAQQLWPDNIKQITHATADALLIAEYCRRKYSSQ